MKYTLNESLLQSKFIDVITWFPMILRLIAADSIEEVGLTKLKRHNQKQSNFKFKFSLARFFAVTRGRRSILCRYYSSASHALRVTPIDPAPGLPSGISCPASILLKCSWKTWLTLHSKENAEARCDALFPNSSQLADLFSIVISCDTCRIWSLICLENLRSSAWLISFHFISFLSW